jgi:HTH-type transcriptional regulator/antitoxin HigA
MGVYKVIGKNGKEIETESILHPGEVLGEELEAREILQKVFAELIDMRPPHLNELIKGRRHISALLALKLEKELGINAAFWLRLQIDYDLKIARRQLKVA